LFFSCFEAESGRGSRRENAGLPSGFRLFCRPRFLIKTQCLIALLDPDLPTAQTNSGDLLRNARMRRCSIEFAQSDSE